MLGLLKRLEHDMVSKGMKSISLTTWDQSKALNFYVKNGFAVKDVVQDRPDGRKTVHLWKDLKPDFPYFDFIESPIETNSRLNDYLGVNLIIKRDDLFPVTGGGSKSRKLKFILKKGLKNGCTAVVSAGSNYSNHLRATAVLCSELGLKFTACIHDQKPEPSGLKGNVKLTTELSHRVHFVSMPDIKQCMDEAVNTYIDEGERPLYIWGGGHCIEGTFSYINAVEKLVESVNTPLHQIFVASGTGTTQAGLILGANKHLPSCRVIGISIARGRERGEKAIMDAIEDIAPYFSINQKFVGEQINFDDRFLFGGYGKVNDTLMNELNFLKKNFGLILDPVYSGKAFFAVKRYIEEGRVEKGSNVLFWNTGGLLNVLS